MSNVTVFCLGTAIVEKDVQATSSMDEARARAHSFSGPLVDLESDNSDSNSWPSQPEGRTGTTGAGVGRDDGAYSQNLGDMDFQCLMVNRIRVYPSPKNFGNMKRSPSLVSDVKKLSNSPFVGACLGNVSTSQPVYIRFGTMCLNAMQRFCFLGVFGRWSLVVERVLEVDTCSYFKLEERDMMWTSLKEKSRKPGRCGSNETTRKDAHSHLGLAALVLSFSYTFEDIKLVTPLGRQNRQQQCNSRDEIVLFYSSMSSSRRMAAFAPKYGSLSLRHLPMAQLQNNMIELASLFMGSVNHGILSHIVAVVVVVGFLLSGILSRFKPGAMVKTLSKTVEETYIHYNGHKDVLNEAAGFEDKINRFRVEAFKLQERRLQARDDFLSWTDCRSWRHYMRETKDIWVEARQRKREIVELKKELKVHMPRELPCEEALIFDYCSWQWLEQSGTSSRRVWGTTVKEGERRPGARNLMGVPSFEEVIADIFKIHQAASAGSSKSERHWQHIRPWFPRLVSDVEGRLGASQETKRQRECPAKDKWQNSSQINKLGKLPRDRTGEEAFPKTTRFW
ncbi:hypothetical protein EDD18DRAFT_1110030 [Armillaria luteobubalina]|uniref:Uncharacterized protein n=1 Tax=Armillaria luteobubalina TaxID=153913 RepID=A0AA39URH0_9AGAR|nr:hypothetical protein EDD18DRAFT_1110030 [Armillaria luteobubalina]